MKYSLDSDIRERLIRAIEATPPRPHHHGLLSAANELLGDDAFHHVLSKGGWFRIGGVLSMDGCHLGTELEDWVNSELEKCDNDFDKFLSRYTDAGLLVTRYMGRTHYFVAQYGPEPSDFLQLEVEEEQEILDRKLVNTAQPPQDRTSLVEPIAAEKVDANPVGSPHYRFARLVDASDMLARENTLNSKQGSLARFLVDWSDSRAAEQGNFCEHWLIANLERYGANAKSMTSASLMSVHARVLKPFQWDSNKTGVALGDQLRDFDRAAGYPGAWYFHYVARLFVPANLPVTLMQDLEKGYAYLAGKDQKLLEKLVAQTYCIN